ncbi:uncharacterized protein isoform X2 [Leptinotarsa decemlineata]|nr:uncharacterized protein LOC111516633 [Leptinotarsa decemlineata]
MLRSIFSLIQNIIDSDKEYNNKKSATVIYLKSNPDNTLNMDLEIDGKQRENLKSIDANRAQSSGSFKITTEQGDTVTCKHFTDQKIVPKSIDRHDKIAQEYEQVAKIGERVTFSNEEREEKKSRKDEPEIYEERQGDANMSVRELLSKLPKNEIENIGKDKDQLNALLEQIQKMKKGMERLQEIAQQFKCSDKFRQDVEFLLRNVAPALEKSESNQNDLTTKGH